MHQKKDSILWFDKDTCKIRMDTSYTTENIVKIKNKIINKKKKKKMKC